MKLISIKCPDCGSPIEIKNRGNDFIFCPYCGNQIEVDDEANEITITHNYNYNKKSEITHTHINREIDDADIIRAKNENMDIKAALLMWLILFFIIILGLGIYYLYDNHNIQNGKIKVEDSKTYKGMKYTEAEKIFESYGFEDIEVVEVEDSWLLNDEVKTVSIGGKTNFTSEDYFEKTDKVIISYYK